MSIIQIDYWIEKHRITIYHKRGTTRKIIIMRKREKMFIEIFLGIFEPIKEGVSGKGLWGKCCEKREREVWELDWPPGFVTFLVLFWEGRGVFGVGRGNVWWWMRSIEWVYKFETRNLMWWWRILCFSRGWKVELWDKIGIRIGNRTIYLYYIDLWFDRMIWGEKNW